MPTGEAVVPDVLTRCGGSARAPKSITLGSATGLKAAFNNGSGTWDSNNGADYALGTGDITVRNGTVGTGNPCGVQQTEPGASFAVNATTVPGHPVWKLGPGRFRSSARTGARPGAGRPPHRAVQRIPGLLVVLGSGSR